MVYHGRISAGGSSEWGRHWRLQERQGEGKDPERFHNVLTTVLKVSGKLALSPFWDTKLLPSKLGITIYPPVGSGCHYKPRRTGTLFVAVLSPKRGSEEHLALPWATSSAPVKPGGSPARCGRNTHLRSWSSCSTTLGGGTKLWLHGFRPILLYPRVGYQAL